MSLYGDALWASGLFDAAETRYRDALAKVHRISRAAITAWRDRWPPAATSPTR